MSREEMIEIGREWLIECFAGQEDEIVEASADVIFANVNRHWDGGWSGFVATACR
jgi:hypothetical protein